MENRYWNRAGALQAEYDEMKNAGFEFSKAHIQLAHSYHRYYNDGDLPGWARSRWDLTQQLYYPKWHDEGLVRIAGESI